MSHAPLILITPLAAALLLLAAIAGLTAVGSWRGTLHRQGRLGLRTPAALETDEAFALANRIGAPLLAGSAAVGLVCALLVLVLPMGAAGAIVVAVLGFIGVFGQFYFASIMGERAAMTVPRPARKPQGGGGCGGCGCGDGGCAGKAAQEIPDFTAFTA